MAISYVGGAGVSVSASATTTPSLTIPSTTGSGWTLAPQAGDLAIAIGAAEREIIPAINWPTAGPTVIQAVTATSHSVRMEYKVLAAGDIGQTMTATVTTARRLSLGLIALRGAGAVAAVNAAADVINTGATSLTHPSITPGDADSMLVSLLSAISAPGAIRTIAGTVTSPYVERVEISSTSTTVSNELAYITTRQLTGGSGVSQTGAAVDLGDRASFFASTLAVSPAAGTPPLPVGWTECRLFHR